MSAALKLVTAEQSPPDFAFKAFAVVLQGYPVFPCGPDKSPLTSNGFKDATTDMEQINSWNLVHPHALVGVPTGSISGIDVVDVDTREAAGIPQMPHTRVHATRRGWHLVYAHTGGVNLRCTAGKVAKHVDTRGEGGYIIWWPAEGLAVKGGDLAPLPQWIADSTAREDAKQSQQPEQSPEKPILAGSRNVTMTSLAGTMRAKGFDVDAILAALEKHNATRCDPPLAQSDLEKIARSVGRYEPKDEPFDPATMFGAVESPERKPIPPRPIPNILPPVVPFDYSLLPAPFAAWVKDTAERKCWSPDILAISLMIAAATLIGRKVVLRPMSGDPTWQIVPNLWGAAIGLPSAAKSPAVEAAFAFLNPMKAHADELFRIQAKAYDSEKSFHDAEVKALEAKRLSLLKGDKDNKPDKAAAREIHTEIERIKTQFDLRAPHKKRYTTSDTTAEKLFDILHKNPQGVCFVADELNRLLKQMETENFATLRSMMLTGYNGNTVHTLDRKTGERDGLEAFLCVSLVGGLQPAIIPSLIGNSRDDGEDGFAQRFGLMVWPDGVSAREDAARPPSPGLAEGVSAIMAKLDSIPMTDSQFVLSFDSVAEAAFNSWRCKMLNDIENGITDPSIATFVAKYPKLLGGLALIISLCDGEQNVVSNASWEKALRWERYLTSHLKRVVGYATSRTDSHARNVIAKIKKGELGEKDEGSGYVYTNARELQRKGVPGAEDSRKGRDLLEWLEELGYLASAPRGAIKGVKEAFLVNPLLFEGQK